jgi:hypothetical protein
MEGDRFGARPWLRANWLTVAVCPIFRRRKETALRLPGIQLLGLDAYQNAHDAATLREESLPQTFATVTRTCNASAAHVRGTSSAAAERPVALADRGQARSFGAALRRRNAAGAKKKRPTPRGGDVPSCGGAPPARCGRSTNQKRTRPNRHFQVARPSSGR